MVKQIVNMRNVVTYAGAFVAFLIGSGFATGQEIMQYFTSYGYWAIAAAIATFVLLSFVGYGFITTGQKEQFEHSSEIFPFYCGKYIGKFFDYFSILFIFMSFIVMVGGAGAAVHQQYGLATWIGGIPLGILAAVTVLLGLNKMLGILGNIGPLIIAMTIFLGFAGIAMNPGGLTEVNEVLPTMNLLKANDTHWLLAVLSYVGFCMLWLAAFMTAMGKGSNSRKEAASGAILGAALFSLAIIVISLGLLANIQEIGLSQVPNLIIANKFSPILGTCFMVIVMLGIYTTAVPLLWTVCARVAKEKTQKFTVLTIGLAALGIFIGLLVPFANLVNYIYVINGYIGAIFLGLMIFKPLIDKFRFKK